MTGPDHEDDDDGERKAQTLRDFERWCAGADGMRVAGGESLAGPAHAWEILARENLFTALMADIVFVGGISELRRVGDLSAARGVEYSPHCPWGPVALTASVHAMAAVPNCEIHGTPPPRLPPRRSACGEHDWLLCSWSEMAYGECDFRSELTVPPESERLVGGRLRLGPTRPGLVRKFG